MSTSASRPPAPTIFIGNIPYDLTEDALIEIFQEVGPVKSFRLVNDRETGMAKGYGFCEYFDTTTAESAVRNLNNHEINGRSIRVDFADEHVTKSSAPKGPVERERPKEEIPAREMPVGMDAVQKAACKMAFLLGGRDVTLSTIPPSTGTNLKVYAMLAEMSKKEMFELLAGMKDVVQRNYAYAKSMLIKNPQLSRTLFLMEIILGVAEAPELPDPTRDTSHVYDAMEVTDGISPSGFAQMVLNPPPPPMQPIGGFDNSAITQQPMTNYQSVVQAPTMFAPSNLSTINVQPLTSNLGVLPGMPPTSRYDDHPVLHTAIGNVAFAGQEHTPMVAAQHLPGVIPGMQVLTQQPGGTTLISGMLGSQSHLLLNQPLSAQPQPMVPLSSLQPSASEQDGDAVGQPIRPTASEPDVPMPGNVFDEQAKNQLNQIMSLSGDQLSALPPEHREQVLAIQRQLGKIP